MDRNRMNHRTLLSLYRWMRMARQVDLLEEELTRRGEVFFQVSGTGHEAIAGLAPHLIQEDFLHCHYRDKALMLARGMNPKAFFDSLYCNAASHSNGRQMSAHMSARELNIMSIVGPLGNNSVQSAGLAAAIKDHPSRPIVLCGDGDGTTQEGEYLEGVAEAARENLPVLFVIEDNRYAISTKTEGKTFYALDGGMMSEFYGIPIHYVDGTNVVSVYEELGYIVDEMRESRKPAFVVMQVERLCSHTNADDQSVYRTEENIKSSIEQGDPILRFEKYLLEEGISPETLAEIRQEVTKQVEDAEEAAAMEGDPVAFLDAKKPIMADLTNPRAERKEEDVAPKRNMREALNEALRQRLEHDDRVYLLGQDIEDPKGDVFGVTKGLSTEYPGRVINAPLSESTILGTAIGQALAGKRPVAFMQFADFLPLAFNQIVSEMGTLYWRTNGSWEAPVILMVPCGAYRPGLGPFHGQSYEAIASHIPGVDVVMPSTAADVAGLLNTAFMSERPTIFFYPKSCLNISENATTADPAKTIVPLGSARKVRVGRDITLVGWGNTVKHCVKTADALEKSGVEAEVIDLRSLSPWDEKTVLSSAEKTARLVIVHEDNHTCGFGAEIAATVAEKTRVPVSIRRVTRSDTWVPCNFANQLEVMPSFRKVLETSAELLDFDLEWIQSAAAEEGLCEIEAIGSGPADESVQILEMYVKPGDQVERGQVIAELEATKSVFELISPNSGTVETLKAGSGDSIDVGETLLVLRTAAGRARRKQVTQEQPGTPKLTKKPIDRRLPLPKDRASKPRKYGVGLSEVVCVTGSRSISNEELLGKNKEMTPDDIVRRTGIESRFWINDREDALHLAGQACWELFERENLKLDDLDLVIVHTTSPTAVTPSMACQLLNSLSYSQGGSMIQAYDINAACSGYLYALQNGYDFLQSRPDGRVLIVTTEVMSPLLDLNDLQTAILFGDAASATVLYGEDHLQHARARVSRPELSAIGEDGSSLAVPFPKDGYIHMNGTRVFREAVRSMVTSLNHACQQDEIGLDDLHLVVPHQANQRILDTISQRIHAEVYSNIRHYGNTSSSSIPLCLAELLTHVEPGKKLGLCAFGGGFTFGAGILEAA
ncbi:Branched-chain ketoacyl-acyl carrier protein synthase III [Planctomycetales bacterium 10988]|nr:Branched-chain ketoacyl-acyl carrier protein synthase III [Planctomycetales bacterium 10988]